MKTKAEKYRETNSKGALTYLSKQPKISSDEVKRQLEVTQRQEYLKAKENAEHNKA